MPKDYVVRRNGLVFSVAFWWKTNEEKSKLESVNLCKLIHRFVISMLGMVVCVAVIAFCALVGALILRWFSTSAVPYLWSAFVNFIAAFELKNIPYVAKRVLYEPPVLGMLTIFFCAGGYVCLAWILKAAKAKYPEWIERHETLRLVIAYIKAKKEKICPIYKIE